MIYGDDKALEMARSLLPSTGRKSAKVNKAMAKRASRHSMREELHRATIDPEYYDDSSTDFEEYPYKEIRSVVYQRRGGDKTAPFERWAEAITKKVDPDSRLTFIKSLVPAGVIGDHAISHIKFYEHFYSRAKLQLEKNIELNRKDEQKKNKGKYRLEEDEQHKLLYDIVADGRLHRELNKFVSSHSYRNTATETIRINEFNEQTQKWVPVYRTVLLSLPPGVEYKGVRKLMGLHDIKDYIRDIRKMATVRDIIYVNGKRYANPEAYRDAYSALMTFLIAVRDKKPLPRSLNQKHYYYSY